MASNVQQNSRGILLVILAMSVFSIQDVLIKFISSNVSLFQILFYRSVIGALLIIIFQRAIGQTIRLWTAYPALSLLRGVFFFFGYSAFYFAQSKMPIANATVLFLVSPFLSLSCRFTFLIAGSGHADGLPCSLVFLELPLLFSQRRANSAGSICYQWE